MSGAHAGFPKQLMGCSPWMEALMRYPMAQQADDIGAAATVAPARFIDPFLAVPARHARDVVGILGGRYSAELGIDVGAGDAEVERWFLAATLFGTRVSARVAERAFAVLDEAGLTRIGQPRHLRSEDLIALLDAGGYTRYDFRMTARLQALSEIIDERYDGQAAEIGRRHPAYPALRAALIALPGWGPVTVRLFLRELRGTWPGARPPLDPRAALGARHLGLLSSEQDPPALRKVTRLAAAAGLDIRDLEGGLVRLALAHQRARFPCPGGDQCGIRGALARGPGSLPSGKGHPR
jgi:hypothetical protein